MGRKSSYISHISLKDTDAFRALWNCQHVPRDLLKVSDNRLASYVKQGIVDECRNYKNQLIYRCTDKGYKFISKLDGYSDRKPYKSTTAVEHNCKLAEIYSGLPREQQAAWRTEKELRDIYQEKLEELRDRNNERWLQFQGVTASACDGGVVETTEVGIEVQVLYEVTTDSYGQEEIDAHEVFAQVFDLKVNFEPA